MNILIVDDSIHVHHQLKVFLGTEDFNSIHGVYSAAEASVYLDKHPVDLILMDIEMEDVDGIEATRRIKTNEAFSDVPILMITGDTSPESLEKAFHAGAVDYITKPIKKVELISRVHSFLTLRSEIRQRKEREKKLIELTQELEKKNIDLEAANTKLEQLAENDGLTDIHNRRFFDKTLKNEWLRAMRTQQTISLIMIDIDYFKKYNDLYGHVKGDECLKRVAGQLKKTLNRSGDFIARYGGEEFVAVLPETDVQGAINIAEQIHNAIVGLNIPHEASSASKTVSISLGIAALTPKRGDMEDSLVTKADQALYQAKKNGRNQWQLDNENDG